MKRWFDDPGNPLLQAAYLDGELEGTPLLEERRRLVERWLEEHPEAAEHLSECLALTELLAESAPLPPSEADWDRVWSSIQAKIEKEKQHQRRWRQWRLGFAVAAAIAILLCGAVLRLSSNVDPSSGTVEERSEQMATLEPLPVVEGHEVEILQVAGEQTPLVVAGELPVKEEMVLASAEDVTVMDVDPAGGVAVPRISTASASPMIWAGEGLEP